MASSPRAGRSRITSRTCRTNPAAPSGRLRRVPGEQQLRVQPVAPPPTGSPGRARSEVPLRLGALLEARSGEDLRHHQVRVSRSGRTTRMRWARARAAGNSCRRSVDDRQQRRRRKVGGVGRERRPEIPGGARHVVEAELSLGEQREGQGKWSPPRRGARGAGCGRRRTGPPRSAARRFRHRVTPRAPVPPDEQYVTDQ